MAFFKNKDLLRAVYNQVAEDCLEEAVKTFKVMHDGAEPDASQKDELKAEIARTACVETGFFDMLAIQNHWNAAAFASMLPSRERQELEEYIDRKCAAFEERARELEQTPHPFSRILAALDRQQAVVIRKTAERLFPRPLMM